MLGEGLCGEVGRGRVRHPRPDLDFGPGYGDELGIPVRLPPVEGLAVVCTLWLIDYRAFVSYSECKEAGRMNRILPFRASFSTLTHFIFLP